MSDASVKWWELTLSYGGATPQLDLDEALQSLLLDQGAEGAHSPELGVVKAYFSQDPNSQRDALIELGRDLGFEIQQCEEIAQEPWIQRCQEVFTTVQVGDLTITPILTSSPRPPEPNEIFIIPGFGWGTGHHESTRLALSLLQTTEVTGRHPQQVLDLGTGSGVLGIVAARCFNARVQAVDIDPLALINAADNAAENRVQEQMTFATHVEGSFDLALVNIYAEVLVALEPQLRSQVRPDGVAILSGIVEPLFRLVRSAFGLPHWRELRNVQENEWCAVLLERVSA